MLASAPNVRHLVVGGVEQAESRDLLLAILNTSSIRSLVIDTRRVLLNVDEGPIALEDLPFVLTLPSLRSFEVRAAWRRATDYDLSVPFLPPPDLSRSSLSRPLAPITTLTLYVNNPPVVLAIVKALGRTLETALIYIERTPPPAEAIEAWSATTETLRVWEHRTCEGVGQKEYDELWIQDLLPRFKKLERVSFTMPGDVEAKFLSVLPPSVTQVQAIHYLPPLYQTLRVWMNTPKCAEAMPRLKLIRLILGVEDSDPDDYEAATNVISFLRRECDINIKIEDVTWEARELFRCW